MNAAMAEETVAGPLDEATIPTCELLILAVYPQAIIEWVRSHEQFISPSTLVIDCGSVKRSDVPGVLLYRGALWLYVHWRPPHGGSAIFGLSSCTCRFVCRPAHGARAAEIYDPDIILWAEEALSPAAFGSFSITTAAKHVKVSRTPRSSPMW